MNIRLINLLGILLLGILIGFSSCEDDNDYDFSAIEPIISSLTGPNEVAAHGLTEFPTRYHVPHRGGSTFAWEITGHGGTFVLDERYSSIAYVTFNQSSNLTAATINVTETTMGGKTSPVFSREITLTPFCPYDMDALVGDWTGTAGAHDDELPATTTGNLNELRIGGLAGFVNFSWGENWTDGDGSCVLEFSCGENIAILPQWIGDTDFPDSYGIIGSGTFDPVNDVITLSYEVFYGWDGSSGTSAAEVETVLTKDGKVMSSRVIKPIPDKIN
jgi:hypothetical protein